MSKSEIDNDELISSGWELMFLNDVEVIGDSYTKGLPTIFFVENSSLTGSTGCNQFMGSYTRDEQNFHISVGATTKMACPGLGESEFLTGLSLVNSGYIVKDKLHLEDTSGKVHMIFNKIGIPETK